MTRARWTQASLLTVCTTVLGIAGLAWLSRGRPMENGVRLQEHAHLPAPDSRIDAPLLVAGARVFDERCSPCHGDRGRGDGVLSEVLPIRPRNYHEDPFKWGTSLPAIVETIRSGRSGIMPSFEGALTEQEMGAVAYLVWNWIPPSSRDDGD